MEEITHRLSHMYIDGYGVARCGLYSKGKDRVYLLQFGVSTCDECEKSYGLYLLANLT